MVPSFCFRRSSYCSIAGRARILRLSRCAPNLTLTMPTWCQKAHLPLFALQSCLEAVARMPFWPSKAKKSKKGKAAATTQGEGDEEVEPIDILTDVIIGFLEASTSYMRTIANQVFGCLSPLVKQSTIDLLVAVRRLPANLAVSLVYSIC